MFVDDDPDIHRVEHAYRQSMPDSYGVGLGMMGGMGGGQGISNLPGAPRLLYGRGFGGMGVSLPSCRRNELSRRDGSKEEIHVPADPYSPGDR